MCEHLINTSLTWIRVAFSGKLSLLHRSLEMKELIEPESKSLSGCLIEIQENSYRHKLTEYSQERDFEEF